MIAYVEDTSDRALIRVRNCADGCAQCRVNFEPRTILEISDCSDQIRLEFDLDSDAGRANSLHKLDTLISALQAFRSGLVEEFEQYESRERELETLTKAAKRGGRKKTAGRR